MAHNDVQRPGQAEPYDSRDLYEPIPTRAPHQLPALLQQQTSYFTNNPPSQPAQLTDQPVQTQPQPQAFAVQQSSVQRPDSNYGDWMAPVAGTAGGAAPGVDGVFRHKQQQQQQQETPVQTQPQAQQHQANALQNENGAIPLTQRHPGHTAAQSHPITSVSGSDPGLAASGANGLSATPSANNQSFLGETEVLPTASAGTSGQTVMNGGAKKPNSVRRMNTEDLHVPGQYPKVVRGR